MTTPLQPSWPDSSRRDVGQNPLLHLESVSCQVNKATLVEQISLSVLSGQFLAILGTNGAGKTTLLSILDATLRPSRGTLSVFGQNPWSLSEARRAKMRAGIGVVPQRTDFNSLIPLSVHEVVAIGRLSGQAFKSSLSGEDRQIIDESMALMGISSMAGRGYRTLSGGEQQKVQLARALAQKPALLLLDEPAAGLDLYWQEQLTTLIGRLNESLGLPVVMTTHILHHLPSCCQRAALMYKGRILFDGPVEEAICPERIGQAFGLPVEILEHGGRRYCLKAGAEGQAP
jgi:ABC-type cobalamin/Fe3+-siderophores transport system ATPase subunit